MYKVAFIDDGIMEGIQEVPKQAKKYRIKNGKIEEKKEKASTFCLSHGTMCFWVFSQYLNDKEYILYDIQILDELTSSGDMGDLTRALQFCLNEEIDLINMSLGKTNFINSEGEDILKQLYARGTIMVAAQNNSNQVTYPACSPYVYGVTRDYVGILEKDQFCYVGNKQSKIDIISHCEIADIEAKYGITMGKQNSFSAPYISALIYNELKKGGNRESILDYLKSNSVHADGIDTWGYKIKSIPNWQENISIPVVGVDAKDNSQKYFEELLDSFRKEEFNAVGIWFGEKLKEERSYIFQYFEKDQGVKLDMEIVVKWVFNITRPDIIFVGYEHDAMLIHNDIEDLILKDDIPSNPKMLSISGKTSEQILEMIITYFG